MKSYLKYAGLRIIRNKETKGFPIGNYPYDLKKIREEVDELEKALKEKGNVVEEVVDIIIMAIGIAEQYEPGVNLQAEISLKMGINDRRKIHKVSDEEFTKEEGST